MGFRVLTALSLIPTVLLAEYFEGDGTSYTLGGISDGNCNFMSAIPTASTNYAALNNDQWDNLANCGRCAEVSCIDDQCADQNTTAIVQILDRCPECFYGALDLSPTVFKTITGSDPSRLSIRWQFVDCPDPGTIQVCLKTGSNGYYVAVQPTNTVIGVQSVTINGQSTAMVDSAYYYLINSKSGVSLSSISVSITSVDGETMDGTYSLTAGECVDTSQQFGTSTLQSPTQSTTTTPASQSTTQSTTQSTSAPTATPETPLATVTAANTDNNTTVNVQVQTSIEGSQDDTYQNDQSNVNDTSTTATPEATTATPEATTTAPETTAPATTAPVTTAQETSAPVTTAPVATASVTTAPETSAPVPSTPETDAPETSAPEATTATPTTSAPTSTPATETFAPTPSGDTSKCRVKTQRRRK